MPSIPEDSSISDSMVIDKLKRLYTALECAIINEEEEKAMPILIKLREQPVSLKILKLSGSVKQLRLLKKHVNNRLCEEINQTIAIWDRRTMVVAKRESVPIKIPGSKKRSKPTQTVLTPEHESRGTNMDDHISRSPNHNSSSCNRFFISSKSMSSSTRLQEQEQQCTKEQNQLWKLLVGINE